MLPNLVPSLVPSLVQRLVPSLGGSYIPNLSLLLCVVALEKFVVEWDRVGWLWWWSGPVFLFSFKSKILRNRGSGPISKKGKLYFLTLLL